MLERGNNLNRLLTCWCIVILTTFGVLAIELTLFCKSNLYGCRYDATVALYISIGITT